jgi:hypothetical protein
MLPLPLLHCCIIYAVNSVVATKFKVATPDVSAPVFISTIRQETVVLFGGKTYKVKAFSTSR